MTKLQKAYSFVFSLCLAGTLLLLPGRFFIWSYPGADGMVHSIPPGTVYRLLPLYSYLERQAGGILSGEDLETSGRMIEANKNEIEKREEKEMAGKKENETDSEKETDFPSESTTGRMTGTDAKEAGLSGSCREVFASAPKAVISTEKLMDYAYLMNHFYIVDENTATNEQQISGIRFLEEDFSLKKDPSSPQILIYHSHSQETFADSREGYREDTVVGVGEYLTELLTEQYGYQVLHVTETFDLFDGELDRSKAYDAARAYISRVLEENPSIRVVIDLHRDGVPEDRRLVTLINGKETAQILFYNGLSYTVSQGPVSYLPNPYIQDNLAFSFQLNYQAEQYFPELSRGIYLAGLRYNLHLCPCALLLEAGAQTNTIQEVKNAMEPFAAILDRVLSKKEKPEKQDSF